MRIELEIEDVFIDAVGEACFNHVLYVGTYFRVFEEKFFVIYTKVDQ